MYRRIQFTLFASFLMLPLVAQAQRIVAPDRSIPPEQVSSAIVKLQKDNADLKLTIRDLRDENARLLGEVEALEYSLRSIRDEAERQARDDRQLSEDVEGLKEIITALQGQLEKTTRQVQANSGFAQLAEVDVLDQSVVEYSTQSFGDTAPETSDPETSDEAGEEQFTPAEGGELQVVEAYDGNPDELFRTGQQRLLAFDFTAAETAFRTYVSTYEEEELTPQAYYWLAETLFQQEAHADAGNVYTDLLQKFPDHPRAPDALWKLARSMRLIDDQDQACALLSIMPDRYPDASTTTKNYANRERALSKCS